MKKVKIFGTYTEGQLAELGLVDLGVPTHENRVYDDRRIFERRNGGESPIEVYIIGSDGNGKLKVYERVF